MIGSPPLAGHQGELRRDEPAAGLADRVRQRRDPGRQRCDLRGALPARP